MDNAQLNSDNDLDWSENGIPWATENEAVRQHIFIRLNIWRGEWFLDSMVGTPYRQYILGSRDPKIATDVLANMVLKTPDVRAPLLEQSYDFNKSTRTLIYNFSCSSKFGKLYYNNVIDI